MAKEMHRQLVGHALETPREIMWMTEFIAKMYA
jgi:hypothetical protein